MPISSRIASLSRGTAMAMGAKSTLDSINILVKIVQDIENHLYCPETTGGFELALEIMKP
ncbi:unnamed protein product [Fusarium venenatum]|uniref:Uncharacterized protein n=1 Tax=Fusarium venenatum TaxID=56646 RepID=A0A2L2TIK6_9HYPO|nr:uncharacterized protein FVRRES_04496 [Fusarium venenatum]CEI60060.1 unnamed protein product [Fusarium venenatum]